MFVQWSDEKHSLGIQTIDMQHQELFIITNEFFDSQKADQPQKTTIQELKRLYAYTKYHFASEEGLFRHFSYPGGKEHREVHNEFTRMVKKALREVREQLNYRIDELLDFLVEWIINHIQGRDHDYADYFRTQGIEPVVHFDFSGIKTGKQIDADALKIWREKKLSLDLGEIDKQHKELVYILQQANDLNKCSDKRKRLYLPVIIKKLFYYSQYHFSFEEQNMSQYGYQHTQEHQMLHKDFINRIILFSDEYKIQKKTLNDEIILFLKDWTLDHILTEDKKYKDFLV